MKQKNIPFSMKIGLWLSAAAILVSASSPFSNLSLVSGKDVMTVTPAGWSGAIVVTKTPGTSTHTSETLEIGNSVYVDIAITNNGLSPITETFNVCLYFDVSTQVHCWPVAGLASNANFTVEDYEMTYTAVAATAGSHALALRADEAAAISGDVNTVNNNTSLSFSWSDITGSLLADALVVDPGSKPADVNTSNSPDISDTSAYMIGKVAVSVILPESNGGTENWTQAEIDQVKAEITEGLNNWESWYAAVNGGDPGLDFVIDWHTNVSITDEPITITNGQGDQDVWINEALGSLGATGADYWQKVYDYNNDNRRDATPADWAFTIFVADSSADIDGRFEQGGEFPSSNPFTYSYLNGPFLVMTYDNADWGIAQMSEVLAHQVGHIFGAADQYSGCSGGNAASTFGYLEIANSNCNGVVTTSSLMYIGQGAPDITTRGQVGWHDSADADLIFDPADTRPAIESLNLLNTTGSNLSFDGVAYDAPWTPAADGRGITIRKLIAIEFRIDGGAWQNVSIVNQPLDSDREEFEFSTGELGGGVHTIDVRATNSSADSFNKYSVVGSGISRYTTPLFSNDLFAYATIISSLPYISTGVNTTTFNGGGNSPEPQDVNLVACGRYAGDHSAWYRYTPIYNENITVDTIGSGLEFDTMLGIFKGDPTIPSNLVGCDDDGVTVDLKSKITLTLDAGQVYYIVASSFNDTMSGAGLSASSEKTDVGSQAGGFDAGGDLVLNVTSNGALGVINVEIAGVNRGTYSLLSGQSTRQNYIGLDNGPVKVISTGGLPIIAAIRDAWAVNGVTTSFSQLMGLPLSQVSDKYVFPAYNNVTLNEQLRIGNVDTVSSTVTVTIGGVLRGTYTLLPNQAVRINYTGLDSGPVVVQGTTGVDIISAIREAWAVNGVTTSFVQLMGLPATQLSNKYVFPAYNNVTLNEQLRIGNVDTSPSTVTVKIGGVLRGTYTLQPSEAMRINYAGIDSGPVVVEGTVGVKIISAIRDAWAVNGVTTSFSQLMGMPAGELSDRYLFPAYNNVTLNEQLRIGNVDIVPSTVTVTIGGVLRGTYTLQPSAAVRINYTGVDSGPVVVQGTAGVDIISAIREAWAVNGVTQSFVQLMGLPAGQLSATYLFPAYNNVTLNEQLRFGVP